jgi:type IV pilus assembly protein PilM
MLSFVKNWLGPRPNPIGVDFGSDSLKLAQVSQVGGEWRLTAAACADVPPHVRHDATARANFFIQTIRELLVQGNFSGRQAVLALPVSSTFIQHLRLPKMDDDAIKKAIPWEARGKLPIDPSHALIRHLIAGDVYQDQEPKSEVIIMAAGRELVNQFLSMAGKAKLDVAGMHVEPRVIVDCFSHIYRRKADAQVTNCFVDLGCAGTRAVIARGSQILFARAIPIGGDHFTRAVASALNISVEQAKIQRISLCNLQPPRTEMGQKQEIETTERCSDEATEGAEASGFAVLDAALSAAKRTECDAGPLSSAVTATATAVAHRPADSRLAEVDAQTAARLVEQACHEPLNKLIEELDMCRRYHEATFTNRPVDRLIFVGGEAKHRGLCQYIAQGLGLAAQVGDPLVRMGRISDVGIESGIDCRQPQPNWSVAIGLSLGAPPATESAEAN